LQHLALVSFIQVKPLNTRKYNVQSYYDNVFIFFNKYEMQNKANTKNEKQCW